MSSYTARRIAEEIIESGQALPQLPAVSKRLLMLTRQPIESIDVTAFSRLVEGDPALTAKILQLANSAYFGTTMKIVSVRQAIMQIGLEETITSVCRFFYQTVLPRFPRLAGFSGKDFWDHSWACATANRMLGHPFHSRLTTAVPGELYIIGLLHGIGKIFLATNRQASFERCLLECREHGLQLDQAEEKVLGTTDTEIAYCILKSWNFPDNICVAIRCCRFPEKADRDYRGLAALTQYAIYLANTAGIGSNGDHYLYDLEQTYIAENWVLPQPQRKQRDRVVQDIYETLRKKAVLLNQEDASGSGVQQPGSGPVAPEPAGRPSRASGLLGRLWSKFR